MSRRTDRNIGIIGLGIIGQRVADSLRRRGFHVFVWNRTPRPFPNFVGSPAEIAQLCDFVQIFVADDEALLEMVQQLKQGLKGHHVVMAHCTVAPATMRAAAEIVQRRGARFLDAPFTGSRMAAEKGELVYYVAGDEAAFQRARPVLEASSKEIIEIGEIGQATTIKLATNMVTAATAQVAAEALALVHASGVPVEKFAEAMRGNASSSGTLSMKLPKMIEGDFDPHFSVKHMLKDVEIVSRLARSYGLFFSATEAARGSLIAEVQEGRSDHDYSSIVHAFFPKGARPQEEESAVPDEQPTLAGLDDVPTELPPADVPMHSEQTGGDIVETAEAPADQGEELLSDAAEAEPEATIDGTTLEEVPAPAVETEPVEPGEVESEPEERDGEPKPREKPAIGVGPPEFALVHLGIGPQNREKELEQREAEPAQGDNPPPQVAVEAAPQDATPEPRPTGPPHAAVETEQSVREPAPLEIAPESEAHDAEHREGQPQDPFTEVAQRSTAEATGPGGRPVSDQSAPDTAAELREEERPPTVAERQSVGELAGPEIATENRAQEAEDREGQPQEVDTNPWPGVREPSARGEGMEVQSNDPVPQDTAPEHRQTELVQQENKPELPDTEQPPIAAGPEESVNELAPVQIVTENREGKAEERDAESAKPANNFGTPEDDLERRGTAPEPRPPAPAQDGKEQDKPKEPAQTMAASKLEQPAAGDEKRPGFFRRLFTFDY